MGADQPANSRMTPARVTAGATSLSNSCHLALSTYSNCVKPVMLPPGRDMRSMKPLPIGSMVCANTIGSRDGARLGFKLAPRLEQVDDEHSKRMQKLFLTSVVLNFSVVISEYGHKIGRHFWGRCYGTSPG